MKKLLLILIAGTVLSCSAMADCISDGNEMSAQINQYGSITSNAYEEYYPIQIYEVDSVFPSEYAGVCAGYGDDNSIAMAWSEDSWGDSLLATYISEKNKSGKVNGAIAKAASTMPHQKK